MGECVDERVRLRECVREVVRVGERLRMQVGARESAFSESHAPESDWECVCGSVCVL